MKKKISSLFLLIFFSCTFSFAQDSTTDSLKLLVSTAPNDSAKVDALISLARNYFSTNPDIAITTCKTAKELAEKINYTKGITSALKFSGIGYYNQSKYVEALNEWELAKRIAEEAGDKKMVANMLSNLGNIYRDQSDNEKALNLYLQSLKIAEEIKDSIRTMTVLICLGATYGDKKTKADIDKAIAYDKQALPYAEALGQQDAIGTITGNLGEIYLNRSMDGLALFYLEKSLAAYGGTEDVPFPLTLIGRVYAKRKEFDKAIAYQQRAFNIAEKLDSKLYMAKSLLELGNTYSAKGDFSLAISSYALAKPMAREVGANLELKKIFEGLHYSYAQLKDFSTAYHYQDSLLAIKDTLYNFDTDKKLGTLLFNFEIEKKQGEINLQQKEISKQKIVRNSFIGGFAIVALFAGVFFLQRNRISKEKKRSDELLLNILPEETAEELKLTGSAKTKSFESVSVLFTDFKNFTQASEKLSPEDLVQEINHCYSEFDKIITNHGIEKIKTIGDAYMCAGGLPVRNNTHPVDVVQAGIEMQDFILHNKKEREEKGLPFFELRLGIHTGPVVAGVVGTKKFAYDIWGDTVNTASRMESSGEVGKVNISGSTYELIKDKFQCEHRGKIKAKNKGEIDMYFVEQPN